MGVEHLADKRSGRPRGSKSGPPWIRDALWAYRNWDKEGLEPPSPGAKLWVALAREQPERFLACLLRLGGQAPNHGKQDPATKESPLNGTGGMAGGLIYDGPLRRLKTVLVTEGFLLKCLKEQDRERHFGYHPPDDTHIVGVHADISQRSIRLVLQSASFPQVLDDKPIPELEREPNP